MVHLLKTHQIHKSTTPRLTGCVKHIQYTVKLQWEQMGQNCFLGKCKVEDVEQFH